MKKLILILCILQGVLLSLRAQGEQQNIAYTDNNVRFTVISDGTLRLEYAPDGKFVDDKSFIDCVISLLQGNGVIDKN